MSVTRILMAMAAGVLLLAILPGDALAWTPGTHVYLAESVLSNLQLLPLATADLLRAFPFDFLYGNIAADSSIAKKYAPVGRHCHYWHVGQEIHDLAETDALRAFGLGYLCHLAADVVAHNFYVPRQLVLTASTSSVGHTYWESRVDSHLGSAYVREARELLRIDMSRADAHLDGIISPTIFSVRTNRRLFRGMVHLADSSNLQQGLKVMLARSRWRLTDQDVEQHLGYSYDFMVNLLSTEAADARRFDPSGESALRQSKVLRRQVLRTAGRDRSRRLTETAQHNFGLPEIPLRFWPDRTRPLPWRAAAPPRIPRRRTAG